MMGADRDAMPDHFDQQLGLLIDLPDVVKTKPSTIRTVPPLGVGGAILHIVQTVRQGDAHTVFLEHVSAQLGTIRLVIPPKVADVIARQRDAVSKQLRSKLARQHAKDRKDRGVAPAFLRHRA